MLRQVQFQHAITNAKALVSNLYDFTLQSLCLYPPISMTLAPNLYDFRFQALFFMFFVCFCKIKILYLQGKQTCFSEG